MNIRKYLSLLALTLLALLAFYGSLVNACSCLPAHPQAHYCSADLVVLIKVMGKSDSIIKGSVVYKVKVFTVYKINDAGIKMLQNNRIVTPDGSNVCGTEMETGKLYVIAGRTPQLNSCSFVKEYKQLSVTERRGLLGYYNKGCNNCEIEPCWGENCHRDRGTRDSCKWAPFRKCETSYSACLPTRYQTPDGNVTSCAWRKTRKYQNCLSDP